MMTFIVILAALIGLIVLPFSIFREMNRSGLNPNSAPPTTARTIRCPHCGSPAKARGSRWECGWCGDFGTITTSKPQAQQPSPAVKKLLNTIIQPAKATISNWSAEMERLCGYVLFYELSLALTRGAVLTADVRQTIEGLCQQTEDKFCSAKEMLHTAETKTPLFSAQAALSESECGTFWGRVIAALPPHRYSEPFPDAVADILNCAEELYAYFFGKDSDGRRRDELWDGFQQHWIRHSVLHPSGTAAKDAIHRQDFSKYEHAYRDLLVSTHPELLKYLEPLAYNELDNLFEDDLLQRTYPKNPALAVSMWRLLLDTASEHLLEPEVAERLIQDDMETVWNEENCAPILDALEADDTFAGYVMQSAYVGEAQKRILRACVTEKKSALLRSLMRLLEESPYPESEWDCSLEELQASIDQYCTWDEDSLPKTTAQFTEAPATPVPGDGPSYRYCQVHFPKVSRPYSYLTEDDSIQAGDWVLAPFGREGADWTGQVERVTVCTAATAPYPPERTKYIISKTDAPPEPTPAPQTEKKSVPPITKSPAEQTSVPETPKAAAVALTATVQKVASVQSAVTPPLTVPKRSFKKRWIAAAALLLALLLAGGTYYYLGGHYDAARAALIAEDYALATTELQRIPAFFRDTQALSQFAQAGLLGRSEEISNLEQAENLLVLALDGYDGAFLNDLSAMKAEVSAKLELRRAEEFAKERAPVYDQALTALTDGNFAQAEKLLTQLPADYEDVSVLLIYAHAAKRAGPAQVDVLLAVQAEIDGIPADYAGSFAAEIAALRSALPQKIADAQAAVLADAQRRSDEESERQARAAGRAEAAAQAAQTVKPPSSSGSGSSSTSGG